MVQRSDVWASIHCSALKGRSQWPALAQLAKRLSAAEERSRHQPASAERPLSTMPRSYAPAIRDTPKKSEPIGISTRTGQWSDALGLSLPTPFNRGPVYLDARVGCPLR